MGTCFANHRDTLLQFFSFWLVSSGKDRTIQLPVSLLRKPQEMQEAMKVAKQVEAANKKSIRKGKAPVTEYTTADVVLSGATVDSGDGRSYLILFNSKFNSI